MWLGMLMGLSGGWLRTNLFELLNDGHLRHLVKIMLNQRGWADKGYEGKMVVSGQVRALDMAGNGETDDAADFGWRRVPVGVIDSRRHSGTGVGGVSAVLVCLGVEMLKSCRFLVYVLRSLRICLVIFVGFFRVTLLVTMDVSGISVGRGLGMDSPPDHGRAPPV